MPSKFKIQISNPCQEEWAGMQVDSNGKFCSSCQKSVIDFTHFTDTELKRWFNQIQRNSCGRFKPEQLDRLISVKENYTLSRFKPNLIAASLVAFFSFSKLREAKAMKTPFMQIDRYSNRTSFEKQSEVLTDTLRTINGRVVDKDDKLPVVGALVSVNNRLAFTSTDQKGNFEIKLPSDFNAKNCTLTITYIGYKSLNSSVDLADNKNLNLELCLSGEILGEMAMIIKTPIWKKVYYKVRNQVRDINPFYKNK